MSERPDLNIKLDGKTFRDFFEDNHGKSLEEAIYMLEIQKRFAGT